MRQRYRESKLFIYCGFLGAFQSGSQVRILVEAGQSSVGFGDSQEDEEVFNSPF